MWLALSVLLTVAVVTALVAGLLWPMLWQPDNDSRLTGIYRWLSPWWRYWHHVCLPLLSWRHRQRLQTLVTRIGSGGLSAESIFAAQCLAVFLTWLIGAALFIWWLGFALYWLPILLFFSALMYWYPLSTLRRRLQQQQLQLQRDFPFMLDLLVLSLEAGMSLLSALQVCVSQLPPVALRQHLQLTLDDLRTGLNREKAFSRFAERIAIDEAHAFVAALQQSFELGGSLGPLLRQQAKQRRQERFLRAEKKALEAPVKMLLPLVVCIFPCTFMVIAYPLVYQLWNHM